MLNIDAYNVIGLDADVAYKFTELLNVYNKYATKNAQKDRYYEGKISVNEVNLGIALPENLGKLEIGCAWGAKTVDVLAARSMFDGFVGLDGSDVEILDEIAVANSLLTEYMKACRDELKYGCTFATLSSDPVAGCKIRHYGTAKRDV